VAWLAQREHSRAELRRKLWRAAQCQPGAVSEALAESPAKDGAEEEAETKADEIERVLDALQAKGLLSDQRFADSRLRARAAGHGTQRIRAELARHGLKLAPQPLQQLRDSELDRAARLWRRRFGQPPADAAEQARQMRFLAGRGFAGDVIRKVVSAAPRPADADPSEGPASVRGHRTRPL
jgi:regulatory protein